MPRSTTILTVPLVIALLTGSAHADSDTAGADALFDEARRLMAEGRFSEACPKLEGAQRLRPGIGTMLNLADCDEKLGKTASAWAMFRDAAVAAQRASDSREAYARERVSALEPRLVKLTVVVRDAEVRGLEVLRNDQLIDRGAFGTALPVDPGRYSIVARAPNRISWSTVIEVDKASQYITIPVLADAPTETPTAPSDAAAPPPPAPSSGRRTIALVVAGAGVAVVAIGSVFGLASKSAHDDADAHCKLGPAGTGCDPQGVSAAADAVHKGNVATALFIVGGVAVASGATLWLTAPTPARRAGVGVALAPFGVLARGTW
jgi:hypothetical protein